MTTTAMRTFRPLRRLRRLHPQASEESALHHRPMANLVSRSLRQLSLQCSQAVLSVVRSTAPSLAPPSRSPSRVTEMTLSTTFNSRLSLWQQASLGRRASGKALGPLCQEPMGTLRLLGLASPRWPTCSRLNPASGTAPSA